MQLSKRPTIQANLWYRALVKAYQYFNLMKIKIIIIAAHVEDLRDTMILAQNPRLLSYLCKLAHSLGNLEVRFDPDARRLTLDQNCSKSVTSNWRYYLLTMLATIFLFQCVLNADASCVGSVLACIFLGVLYTAAAYTFEVRRKAIEIRDCVNALFQLDSILPGKPGVRTLLLLIIYILFVYIVNLTTIILPLVFVHGFHWINSCRLTLVGYFLIPRCHLHTETALTDIAIQLFLILLNHWMWSFVFHGTMFGACVVLILAVTAVQQFIKR